MLSSVKREPPRKAVKDLEPSEKSRKVVTEAEGWIKKSGFVSADALAGLLQPLASPKKKAR